MQNPQGEEHAYGARRFLGQPLVSVVIPAHNEEKWTAACLESVLRVDSYPNKEVIVVNDASIDRTSEILERFHVNVIRTKKPVGPSSARNIGVKEANGEIIVFIDAHCVIDDPEWIQKLLQFFCDPEVGAVGGHFRRGSSKWRPSLALRPVKRAPRLRVIKSANAAYRRVVFEQVQGFDPAMEWGGDVALTHKVRRSGWRVVHSDDIMVVHAEKIWPIRKAFLYGTCHFLLLKKYPRVKTVKGPLLSPMRIGPLLTFGLIADLLLKFPIFTLSLVVLVSLINGTSARVSIPRIPVDGFYTTVWCFTYYLGAMCGLARNALFPSES